MIILFIIALIGLTVQCLYKIYLFQIKEYRFDRIYSIAREKGIFHYIYLHDYRLPAMSIRNILMMIHIIGMIIITALIGLEINWFFLLLSIGLPLIPPLAFIFVTLATIMTDIPSKITRYITILRAQHKVKKSKALFIGITGSYGKSSVKEYLATLLSSKKRVGKTRLNMNTEVGIALSILQDLHDDTELFIVETGAYQLGEIARAVWYIPFHSVILTGLGNQHVDLYGSRDNLITEESWLLTRPGNNGTVYVPADQPEWQRFREHISAKIVTYGFQRADIKAQITQSSPSQQQFSVSYRRTLFQFKTHLPGRHSVANLLPAIACALDAHIPPSTITHKIATIPPITGKLSLHRGRHIGTFLNDSSNSNVEGFKAAIQVLNSSQYQKKIIITQGIIELGVEKRESYEGIMQLLATTDILLLSTDYLFLSVAKNNHKNKIMTFNDVSSLIKKLMVLIDRHTIVLIEGKFSSDILRQLI